MTQRRRVKLSANQRMDMWGRWKAGQSLYEIGRAFGKDHVSIQFMLAQHGGIPDEALASHNLIFQQMGGLSIKRRSVSGWRSPTLTQSIGRVWKNALLNGLELTKPPEPAKLNGQEPRSTNRRPRLWLRALARNLWYAKIPSVVSSDREVGTYLL
jgi:hypothetical protein